MRKLWSVAVLLAVLPLCASAAVKIVESEAEASAESRGAPSVATRVIETGERPSVLPGVKLGAEQPLKEALRKIAPKGWKGFSRDADVTKLVSWDTATSWVDALKQVLEESGHMATVDWEKKRLLIAKAPKVESRKPAPVPTATVSTTERPATPTKPEVPTAWDVSAADGDLESLLTRWAKVAKWQISWEMPNKRYPITFTAMLPGSFEDAARQALRPYSRGPNPIKGCIYDNRVLRVVAKPVQCELD